MIPAQTIKLAELFPVWKCLVANCLIGGGVFCLTGSSRAFTGPEGGHGTAGEE